MAVDNVSDRKVSTQIERRPETQQKPKAQEQPVAAAEAKPAEIKQSPPPQDGKTDLAVG